MTQGYGSPVGKAVKVHMCEITQEFNDVACNLQTILNEIVTERVRQDELWGNDKDVTKVPSLLEFMSILGEEYGQVCKANNEYDMGNLRTELIQVAAVCVRIVKAMDRGVTK